MTKKTDGAERLRTPDTLRPPPSPGSQGAPEVSDPNYTAASAARRVQDGGFTRRGTGPEGSPSASSPGGRRGKRPEATDLNQILAADAMTTDVDVCTPQTEIYYAARIMAERDCGAVPVVESTDSMKPLGILTDRDIVVRTVARRQDPAELTAGDCMTPSPLTVSPHTSLQQCINLMDQRKVRRLIVVDQNGRCCGILAQADIARTAPWAMTGHLVMDVSEPSPGQGLYQ
jgi:CBS domain-containing protein